jgi:serine/threonine protein kinase
MEKAFYCRECSAVNLLENNNKEFLGACHQCGTIIREIADGITKNTIIADRYQILDILEEGHTSDIYFATDLSTQDLVLIRIYCFDYSFCISNPEEFLHMAESVSKLAQKTHIEIIDYGLDDDLIFIVWPEDSIESLDRLLEQHESFEPEVAAGICLRIAKCLSKVYDETGICHYDINTKNIFVNSQGYVKLAGLGFTAQLYQDSNFQESDVEYYDWQYQSPEITLNLNEADVRSDMFSLGFCLYSMVSGKKPFDQNPPVSSADFERLYFTRSEQFRLGDSFVKLFRRLTAINRSDRFNSWHDVIRSINHYLDEEGAVKKSTFSGKVRSMTTSYDLEHFKENENPTPPTKKIKMRSPRKPMSAGDIKKNQRISKSPRKKSTAKNTAVVGATRPRKKKKRDNTVPIIIAVAAALGVLLMIILVTSKENNQNNTTPKTKGTSKENQKNSELKKSTAQKNDPIGSTPRTKNVDPNSLEAFNEIKFELRELALKRQWEKTLAKCDLYTGPFKPEMATLRKSIIKQRDAFLESQITGNSPKVEVKPKPDKVDEKIDPEVDDNSEISLESLAELIYKGQVLRAISRIPSVEKKENLDLNLLEKILETATEGAIDDLIAENYQKEVGKIVTLNVDGVDYKGTLVQVIADNNELKINVVFQGRQFERIYSFDKIHFINNIQRVVKNDKDETALLQFIYLVRKREYETAQKALSKYAGPLKSELLKAMSGYKNDEAQNSWQDFLKEIGLNGSQPDNDFIDDLSKLKLSANDAWIMSRKLITFSSASNTSAYFQKIKHLVALVDKVLKKKEASLKKANFIVSVKGIDEGTVTMEDALLEAQDGELIRILPGVYPGNYIVNKKIRLFGSKDVIFNDGLTISSNRAEFENITFDKGFVDISRNVRDLRLFGIMIRKEGLVMRGDNSAIEIENCLMHGLKLGRNRQLSFKDCIILENPSNKSAIDGFLSGEITNSIIRSKDAYALTMSVKTDSTLSIKYSLVYGGKGIALLSKSKVNIESQKDFTRKVGRTTEVKIIEPIFVEEDKYNYRLKDFTPGFFEGENKKSIGLQYNYTR